MFNKYRFFIFWTTILLLLLVSIDYFNCVSRINNDKSHKASYHKVWDDFEGNRVKPFNGALVKTYFSYEWYDFKIGCKHLIRRFFHNQQNKQPFIGAGSVNLFLDKQDYFRFQNDQKLRKQIARFKSPIVHKKKYRAIYVNDSGDTSKVTLKNVGMNQDHYIGCNDEDSFTSIKIQFGKRNNEYGKKVKKGLLRPETRGRGLDVVANELYSQIADGIKINSEVIELIVNGRSRGEFIMEDSFDKFLLEANGRRDGAIFEVGFNGPLRGQALDGYSPEDCSYNNISGDTTLSNHFIDSVNRGRIPYSLIDEHKFEAVLLLCHDFFGWHPLIDINLHWYHNPVNNLFEPTIREVSFNDRKNGAILNEFELLLAEDNISTTYIEEKKLDFELLRRRYYSSVDIAQLKKVVQSFPKIQEELNIICQELEKYANDTSINQKQSYSDEIIWDSLVNLDKTFTLLPGQTLVIKDGAEVNFGQGAILRIEGKWICNNDRTVKFNGIKNNSIYVENSELCELRNLEFQNFENLFDSSSHHYLPSAITFYQSIVRIKNCSFNSNTRGDDYLNFFRCPKVVVSSCYFSDVLADAIDSDFSALTVENSFFTDIGNDAIDVSGSVLTVNDCKFIGVLDKAVSAGEASEVEVKNCWIENSALGIVSKDGSDVYFDSCHFTNNTLDVSAFQKKLEYSSAQVFGYNSIISSSLIEDGVRSNIGESRENDVVQLMYGKKYGRETKK